MTSVLADIWPWMAGSQKMQEQCFAPKGNEGRSGRFAAI
jgi:hypothetical protein